MGLLTNLLEDNTDEARKKWRKTVGLLVLGLTLFCSAIVVPVLFTGLPVIGQVAWANDVDATIDKKVTAAVAPISEQVTKLQAAVDQQGKSAKALLARLSGEQIDTLAKRRCKSSDIEEREYLSREINRLRDEFEETQGRRYRELTCDQLGYREAR